MSHYLDRFENCKIKIIRKRKDPDTVGTYGPEESAPETVYQDLFCYLSKKNGTQNFIAGKYIGEDIYQILLKKSLLDPAKPINDETDTVEVTEYKKSTTHPRVGTYRVVEFDPERGQAVRKDLHAKFYLTRASSIDEVV